MATAQLDSAFHLLDSLPPVRSLTDPLFLTLLPAVRWWPFSAASHARRRCVPSPAAAPRASTPSSAPCTRPPSDPTTPPTCSSPQVQWYIPSREWINMVYVYLYTGRCRTYHHLPPWFITSPPRCLTRRPPRLADLCTTAQVLHTVTDQSYPIVEQVCNSSTSIPYPLDQVGHARSPRPRHRRQPLTHVTFGLEHTLPPRYSPLIRVPFGPCLSQICRHSEALPYLLSLLGPTSASLPPLARLHVAGTPH